MCAGERFQLRPTEGPEDESNARLLPGLRVSRELGARGGPANERGRVSSCASSRSARASSARRKEGTGEARREGGAHLAFSFFSLALSRWLPRAMSGAALRSGARRRSIRGFLQASSQSYDLLSHGQSLGAREEGWADEVVVEGSSLKEGARVSSCSTYSSDDDDFFSTVSRWIRTLKGDWRGFSAARRPATAAVLLTAPSAHRL